MHSVAMTSAAEAGHQRPVFDIQKYGVSVMVFAMADYEVLIIGAGLAGLSCGVELTKRGKSFKILEAGEDVGGRVQTDVVDDFRLDRGFQIFLTAYPEAQRVLDYEALNLKRFKSGALVRYGGKFCRISDVIRHPADLPGTLFSRAASIGDKLKIASLRNQLGKRSIAEIAQAKNITTRQRLIQFGFSDKVIGAFFRPFFGGVFLESQLQTSRRMFDFVFKMFAAGHAAIPALGMGEIPKQLASRLPETAIELNCRVKRFSKGEVETQAGQVISAENVVVAVQQNAARQLVGDQAVKSCSVTCLYFIADQSPIGEPILVLNGDEFDGPINNLCVPSDVSGDYAPAGQALVSATVLGAGHAEGLVDRVLEQATHWYGDQVRGWRHLKTYEIEHALPLQGCEQLETVYRSVRSDSGVVYCGDYLSFASIQGAMETGRLAAEAVD